MTKRILGVIFFVVAVCIIGAAMVLGQDPQPVQFAQGPERPSHKHGSSVVCPRCGNAIYVPSQHKHEGPDVGPGMPPPGHMQRPDAAPEQCPAGACPSAAAKPDQCPAANGAAPAPKPGQCPANGRPAPGPQHDGAPAPGGHGGPAPDGDGAPAPGGNGAPVPPPPAPNRMR